MSVLLKKTICDCQPPTPEDKSVEHKWTCGVCGTEWTFLALWTQVVRYHDGFWFWRKTRTVTRTYGGTWGVYSTVSHRVRWEPVP